MPYVRCPTCALTTYSAACWLDVDHCVRCDAELPRPRRFAHSREGTRSPARDGVAAGWLDWPQAPE